MTLIASETQSLGTDFKCPAGTHIAICFGVVDLGHQFVYDEKEQSKKSSTATKQEVLLHWVVSASDEKGAEKTYYVNKRYTLSLHEKASLRQSLDAWRGRPFTSEELAGFDLLNILGKPCILTVGESKDGKWAKVTNVTAMMKGVPAPQLPEGCQLYHFDYSELDVSAKMERFAKVPRFIQKWVSEAVEFEQFDAECGKGVLASVVAAQQLEKEDVPF